MDSLLLTYPQVESVLAALHDVAPAKRNSLMGRIKNLRQKGFPEGTNTGRGRPADYRGRALIDLLLAFELFAIGLPPDRVIEALRAVPWESLTPHIGKLGAKLANGLADGSADMAKVLGSPVLLMVDPDGLRSMRSDQASTDERYAIWLADEGEGELQDALFAGRRFAAVNLTRLYIEAALAVRDQTGTPITAFGFAMVEWTETGVWPND